MCKPKYVHNSVMCVKVHDLVTLDFTIQTKWVSVQDFYLWESKAISNCIFERKLLIHVSLSYYYYYYYQHTSHSSDLFLCVYWLKWLPSQAYDELNTKTTKHQRKENNVNYSK